MESHGMQPFGTEVFTERSSLALSMGCTHLYPVLLSLSSVPWCRRTSLFNHSPWEGHLGGFQFLSFTNKDAVNVHVIECLAKKMLTALRRYVDIQQIAHGWSAYLLNLCICTYPWEHHHNHKNKHLDQPRVSSCYSAIPPPLHLLDFSYFLLQATTDLLSVTIVCIF